MTKVKATLAGLAILALSGCMDGGGNFRCRFSRIDLMSKRSFETCWSPADETWMVYSLRACCSPGPGTFAPGMDCRRISSR